ncbi:CueP family metal-binding protein [Salinicoccus roseus]|uniref:CueP family metal-binding protein n=1 Tax=Salinicoccus roseus TaxID=45670 RepID=A0A0C2E6N0_9STAP|nr:CueP family metal-binding protein [Salinicoccus roseus]KIH70982.1 hypothetical protein SN16_05335 [Salinicoccus roseus]MDB0580209.1 CueP family metal-binding protein [Salinicoccus roseus]
MKRLFLPFILISIILAGCGSDDAAGDIKALVDDYSANKEAEAASITGTELIIGEDQSERHSLPEDEFFVSIAPFINYTHPCEFHSLTGCQGELSSTEMDVRITDETGKVHVDETMTTLENGFLDFWLPRDREYTITITHDGLSTEGTFTTFEDDSTCLTDFQLK